MAYALPFVKIDFIGDCYGQEEIWTTGLKLYWGDPTQVSPDSAALTIIAEEMAGLWETFFLTPSGPYDTPFSNKYRTTEVKASLVGTNGKLVTDSVSYFYPAPVVGNSGGSNPAPQTAIVGTLRGTKPRGAGSVGRMYLPGLVYNIQADGLLSDDYTGRLATAFANFIKSVNEHDFDTGVQHYVILSSPVKEGYWEAVDRIGVDSKVDTQRRRANALIGETVMRDLSE